MFKERPAAAAGGRSDERARGQREGTGVDADAGGLGATEATETCSEAGSDVVSGTVEGSGE
jgi:hypothetical protein